MLTKEDLRELSIHVDEKTQDLHTNVIATFASIFKCAQNGETSYTRYLTRYDSDIEYCENYETMIREVLIDIDIRCVPYLIGKQYTFSWI